MAPMLAAEMFPYSRLKIFGSFANVLEHGLKVFQVQKKKALVVGDLEHQRQHTGLRIVEIKNAAEEQRTHFRYGGSNRMALLAEDVPEGNGAAGEVEDCPSQASSPAPAIWDCLSRAD